MVTTEWWSNPTQTAPSDPEPDYSTIAVKVVVDVPAPAPAGQDIDSDCDHDNVACRYCSGLTESGCGGHVFECQNCSECEYEHNCRDCYCNPDCDHRWRCDDCGGTSTDEDYFS